MIYTKKKLFSNRFFFNRSVSVSHFFLGEAKNTLFDDDLFVYNFFFIFALCVVCLCLFFALFHFNSILAKPKQNDTDMPFTNISLVAQMYKNTYLYNLIPHLPTLFWVLISSFGVIARHVGWSLGWTMYVANVVAT